MWPFVKYISQFPCTYVPEVKPCSLTDWLEKHARLACESVLEHPNCGLRIKRWDVANVGPKMSLPAMLATLADLPIILWESLPSPTLFSDRPQSSLYSREDICILQSPARGRDLWFQMEHWSVQSNGQWVSSPSFRWEDTQVTRPLPSLPISPSQ